MTGAKSVAALCAELYRTSDLGMGADNCRARTDSVRRAFATREARFHAARAPTFSTMTFASVGKGRFFWARCVRPCSGPPAANGKTTIVTARWPVLR